MKIIVTGASGFVGTEIVRQCLNNPNLNSVIALARKPIKAPSDLDVEADASKLQSLTLENYGSYSEEVRRHFSSADGCIWYAGILRTQFEC